MSDKAIDEGIPGTLSAGPSVGHARGARGRGIGVRGRGRRLSMTELQRVPGKLATTVPSEEGIADIPSVSLTQNPQYHDVSTSDHHCQVTTNVVATPTLQDSPKPGIHQCDYAFANERDLSNSKTQDPPDPPVVLTGKYKNGF